MTSLRIDSRAAGPNALSHVASPAQKRATRSRRADPVLFVWMLVAVMAILPLRQALAVHHDSASASGIAGTAAHVSPPTAATNAEAK